ncbi:MAG: hypothetical protein IJC53_04295 [Clostridia bacterium]|nr:hypothetical protein [Clostridia bacterium]
MRKVAYTVAAGIGGGLIGVFARQAATALGANMLVLGAAVLVFSIVKSSRDTGK